MSQPFRIRNVLVATDFSPESARALAYARELASVAGPAHVVLVHAYYLPPELLTFVGDGAPAHLEALSEHASKELEKALVELQEAGISADYVTQHGRPEQVVVRVALERSIDLIVMGTHGRTGLAHLALGSVACRVVQSAPCPVLTVKGAAP